MAKFGELLRSERKRAKKTLGQVADAVGCKISYLSDVELSRRNPFKTAQILKIAEELQCDPGKLILAAASERGVTISTKDPRLNGIAASLARSGERLTPEQLAGIEKQVAQIEEILGLSKKEE